MSNDAFNLELQELLRKYDLEMKEPPRLELKLPLVEKSWNGRVPVCRTVTKVEICISACAEHNTPWVEDATRRRGEMP